MPAPFPCAKKGYISVVSCNPESMNRSPRPVPSRLLTMSDKTDGPGNDTSILTKPKTKTQRPPLYKVLLLNDDYTPMEFVVHVLERFFGLNHAQAFEIMLTVHKKGLAVVGVFSFEVAETKVAQVMDFSRRHQHPLQCTMEKE
jgi:ATP-dependent Clp protease adaptor protein ClpS